MDQTDTVYMQQGATNGNVNFQQRRDDRGLIIALKFNANNICTIISMVQWGQQMFVFWINVDCT